MNLATYKFVHRGSSDYYAKISIDVNDSILEFSMENRMIEVQVEGKKKPRKRLETFDEFRKRCKVYVEETAKEYE